MNTTIKKRIEEINSGRVPEGYEKTSFGIFPCDWENKKFQQICDIFSGGTPNTNVREYWDGDIPWCVPTDITSNSKYIWQTERNITRLGLDNSSSIVMPENSILMCSRATIGPRCINKVPMATNQGFKNLVCKKGYEYEFIYYYIDILLKNLLKKSNGSTFLELSKSELEKSECVVPNNKEQSRIAEILTQWDKAIELQEKYIKQLELRKKALMQRLLTPKEGWKKTSLKEVLIERVELASKKNEFVHVTLGKEGVVDKTAQYNRDFLVKNDDKLYKITRFNDICYNPANLKFGVICVNKYGTAIFSPIYITFSVNEGFNVDFIGEILSSANFIEMIRKYEEGTVYERQAVKPSDFLKGIIYVPEKKVQDRIALLIAMINKDLDLQTQKLDNLIKQRKALQQYLLTGIVRV